MICKNRMKNLDKNNINDQQGRARDLNKNTVMSFFVLANAFFLQNNTDREREFYRNGSALYSLRSYLYKIRKRLFCDKTL